MATVVDHVPRLFIVCGRNRTIEELRELFQQCGSIRQLHLATDRSHKSRGFAFLQYEQTGCAERAIKRFDHMVMGDGHLLKVTIAKEKTCKSPRKLKRTSQGEDEESERKRGHELQYGSDGVKDDTIPGKRQRSSPPMVAVPLWPTESLLQRQTQLTPVDHEILQVMEDMICTIETEQGVSFSIGKTLDTLTMTSTIPPTTKVKLTKAKRKTITPITCSQHSQRVKVVKSRDESESSTESDVPRKRSSVEQMDAMTEATRRKLSDLTELSVSSPTKTKKRCNRRVHSTPFASSIKSPGFQSSPSKPHTRSQCPTTLFFTSIYKFTQQELEAMFSIYGHFESVSIVRSFGRIKTMAYIRYSNAIVTRSVLHSFLKENDVSDEIQLKYAEDPSPSRPSTTSIPVSSAGETTSSSSTNGKLWLLVLYDPSLSQDDLSSFVMEWEGMEFIDFKVFRSTGESQGVAFVKFTSEVYARQASNHFHNMEFPIGSRKVLQAIVITDPRLFSTPHCTTVERSQIGEDGELGIVEAKFAHLMSPREQPSGEKDLDPLGTTVHTSSASFNWHDPYFPTSSYRPAPYGYGYSFHGQENRIDGWYDPRQYPQYASPLFYGAGPIPWGFHSCPNTDTVVNISHHHDRDSVAAEGSTVVHISSTIPFQLGELLEVLEDVSGVVGVNKDEREGVYGYLVDFKEPQLAQEAANTLDGKIYKGITLRVVVETGVLQQPTPGRDKKRQCLGPRGVRK